jgi:hypothetical protein
MCLLGITGCIERSHIVTQLDAARSRKLIVSSNGLGFTSEYLYEPIRKGCLAAIYEQ